jgi:hypothetical protein
LFFRLFAAHGVGHAFPLATAQKETVQPHGPNHDDEGGFVGDFAERLVVFAGLLLVMRIR